MIKRRGFGAVLSCDGGLSSASPASTHRGRLSPRLETLRLPFSASPPCIFSFQHVQPKHGILHKDIPLFFPFRCPRLGTTFLPPFYLGLDVCFLRALFRLRNKDRVPLLKFHPDPLFVPPVGRFPSFLYRSFFILDE